jgi:DNA polymerase III subunit epsilon
MSARVRPPLSARARLWFLFGGLALATAGLLAGGVWLSARSPLPQPLYWSAAGLALVTLQALIWLLLDRTWLQPSRALAREIRLLLHANAERPIAAPEGHGLGELVPAITALAEAWRRSHAEQAEALAAATARASEQQSRLEAVLRDLSDGLIACSADRRILLFNDAALRIFGANPELGLDRPLDRLIAREPIAHAFELLRERQAEAASGRAAEERAEFVCATVDGARLLRGRMALIQGPDGSASGFVLDLIDATARLERQERQNARLGDLIQAQRGPAAALRAAAEVLAGRESLPAAERAAFLGVLERESAALSAQVEALATTAENLAADDWPSADLYSADLVRWVNRRLAAAPPPLALTAVGAGLWLHGDGYHLCLLLARLARSIQEATGAPCLDLEVHEQGRRVALDLVWQGGPLPLATLEAWLDQPLDPAQVGGARLREVLRRHQSEIWSQPHHRAGHAVVRLPLPGPRRPQVGEPGPAVRLPPRPEFYDFDLLARTRQPASLLERPLAELSYVVLDTETTGLDPAGGDRVIQIAGVRIVNRRLLTGEVFEALVDPGRPIPKASIRYHGITDQMVQGRPPLEIVLPQFHAFAEGAVLVAHNAAFDMAFLRRDEERLGLRFDQPVLDTLLLSAVVHDHTPEHALDAIAARFGVTLGQRHQALGDAVATGQVFLRLLELLEAQGVRTLGEALAVSARAVELRRRQAAQFGPPQGRGLRRAGRA